MVEVLAHARFGRQAETMAQVRRADGFLQRPGKGCRIFRRHDKTVFPVSQQFRNAGNIGGDADKILA